MNYGWSGLPMGWSWCKNPVVNGGSGSELLRVSQQSNRWSVFFLEFTINIRWLDQSWLRLIWAHKRWRALTTDWWFTSWRWGLRRVSRIYWDNRFQDSRNFLEDRPANCKWLLLSWRKKHPETLTSYRFLFHDPSSHHMISIFNPMISILLGGLVAIWIIFPLILGL